MSAFGLQNQSIVVTPAGYIRSTALDGNDGSGVVFTWQTAGLAVLLSTLNVGLAFSTDLATFSTDPGSPSAQLGFHTVSGTDPVTAGFTLAGTTLSNAATRAVSGVFQLVAVRAGVAVLSPPLAFSITSPVVGADTVAPTIPTGITAAPGSTPGTVAVGFDVPADVAPQNAPASGVAHVDVLVNGAVATPPSPVITPTNALVTPSIVNVGNITNPDVPGAAQNGTAWTVSAAGTGITGTTTEQGLLLDFGAVSGAQRLVAQIPAYSSPAGSALLGVMIHETNAQGGAFLAIGLRPQNGTVGLYVIERTIAGTPSAQVATQINDANGHAIVAAYVKIERAADNKTLTVFYSLDQSAWLPIVTRTVVMGTAVHYNAFAASALAGTDVVGIISEIAVTAPTRAAVVLSVAQAVNIQLRSVDNNTNTSALSAGVQGVPSAVQSATRINYNPGHYFQVGNENHSNDTVAGLAAGTSDSQVQGNLVLSKDINRTARGLVGVYHWDQLEGALGDYSKADALIGPMVTWCKARGLTWSVAINNTGNVGNGSTTFSTVPAYMNSTTYGPIDTNGNHGAIWYTATEGPITRITNDAVCTRLAALGKHLWDTYGRDIFCFMPLWSELAYSTNAVNQGGFNTNAVVNACAKTGGFFDQLRANMPGTYLYVPPTYLGSGNPAQLAPWFAATDRNFITNGNFDSCNETGGTNSRANVGDPAFRGGQMVGGVFQAIAGLTNRVGTQDFATHSSEDTMNQRNNNAVPPAHLGDGRLTFVWLHDVEMQTSHKFWANTQNNGPNCNCITSHSGAPADYAEAAPWASRGLAGFIDYIGPPPRTAYPPGWP